MRLNKFLSQVGIASRRKSDLLIQQGKVKVNGQVVAQLGSIVDPQKDEVMVNGKKCTSLASYIYLVLNKPKGYVCTHAKYKGEKSIFIMLPLKYGKLKIAGRLDKYSEGLVILSDDGEFIYRLTHPKFKHEKEYEAVLNKPLSKKDANSFLLGVKITEGMAKFDRIKTIGKNMYSLVLHQGWNRQIRRMFEQLGYRVHSLKRIREEKFLMRNLESGKYRGVNRSEII